MSVLYIAIVMIRSILFPHTSYTSSMSLVLLFLRLVFGVLFILHGIGKLENFATLADNFSMVMGMGSRISLILVIFAELFCGMAFVLGLLFRLALVPMIITMVVAFGVVHHGVVAQGELALIYLLLFLLLAVTGPGRYALDTLLGRCFTSRGDAFSTTTHGLKSKNGANR